MVEEILCVPDASIWELRTVASEGLVGFARQRSSQQLAVSGASPDAIEAAEHLFDPNTLTLGFARRFAAYKRANLLPHDPERLLRLLTDSQRPVQLIVAGKAHPADLPGQALIQEWMRFIDRAEARSHVVFLSDYDMLLTEQLVQRADVWINAPRRPWDACGASGMKVLVNGCLNLSELDGWWAAAYAPDVGRALGDGREHGDDSAWDATDAEALYSLLEREVIPEFYTRDQNGIPDKVAAGRQIADWQHALKRQWANLRFGGLNVETFDNHYEFELDVHCEGLDPRAVRMELYADCAHPGAAVRQEMQHVRPLEGSKNSYVYAARNSGERPPSDSAARVIPYFSSVAVPVEAAQILWQR